MLIIKFPKFKKQNKHHYVLNVRVVCKTCGTMFVIDDINDLNHDLLLSFEGDTKTPAFGVTCPYCENNQYLSYKQCERIKKHMDVCGINIKDVYILSPISEQ